MRIRPIPKLTITYVTDGDLNEDDQKRVIQDVVTCGGNLHLRIAFRLPEWSDAQVSSLVSWYVSQALVSDSSRQLLPALIHNRPSLVEAHSGTQLWLPWRNREHPDVPPDQSALSIHDLKEYQEAVSLGMREVFFGNVFPTESHPGEVGRGIEALNRMSTALADHPRPPLITAIGGIDQHTIADIGKIRCANVAAIRAISRSEDIHETILSMQESWLSGWMASEA